MLADESLLELEGDVSLWRFLATGDEETAELSGLLKWACRSWTHS